MKLDSMELYWGDASFLLSSYQSYHLPRVVLEKKDARPLRFGHQILQRNCAPAKTRVAATRSLAADSL